MTWREQLAGVVSRAGPTRAAAVLAWVALAGLVLAASAVPFRCMSEPALGLCGFLWPETIVVRSVILAAAVWLVATAVVERWGEPTGDISGGTGQERRRDP